MKASHRRGLPGKASVKTRAAVLMGLLAAGWAGQVHAAAGAPLERDESRACVHSAPRPDGAAEPGCRSALADRLGFDPTLVARFHTNTELTYGLAFRITQAIDKSPSECAETVKSLRSDFMEYAVRRLLLLLEASDTLRFNREYRTVLNAFRNSRSRACADHLSSSLKTAYARAVYRELLHELEGSPWEHFRDLKLSSFESWGREWELGLGRAAPAAVNMATRRIALGYMEYDSWNWKIFIFHELAHLALHDAAPGEEAVQNEKAAWRETFLFLGHIESRGVRLPWVFEAIRTNAGIWGLDRWVDFVLDARKGTHR